MNDPVAEPVRSTPPVSASHRALMFPTLTAGQMAQHRRAWRACVLSRAAKSSSKPATRRPVLRRQDRRDEIIRPSGLGDDSWSPCMDPASSRARPT